MNGKGTEHTITKSYTPVSRGGKGFELIKRDRLVKMLRAGHRADPVRLRQVREKIRSKREKRGFL